MTRMKALSTIEDKITRIEEDLSKIKNNMIPWTKNYSKYRKINKSMKIGRPWKSKKERQNISGNNGFSGRIGLALSHF